MSAPTSLIIEGTEGTSGVTFKPRLISPFDLSCMLPVRSLTWWMRRSQHDLVERMESRHGLRQLTYMKELGMGNDRYRLVDIDNGDAEITREEAVAHVVPFAG